MGSQVSIYDSFQNRVIEFFLTIIRVGWVVTNSNCKRPVFGGLNVIIVSSMTPTAVGTFWLCCLGVPGN